CRRPGPQDKFPGEVRERPCSCRSARLETPAVAFAISLRVPYLEREGRGTGSRTLSSDADRPMSLPANGEGLTERDRKTPRLTLRRTRLGQSKAVPRHAKVLVSSFPRSRRMLMQSL